MNTCSLIGRLVADPDVTYKDSGKVIANICIAVRRNKDVSEFINITAFDKTAETVANYCKKGGQVGINGRLQVDKWVDRESGANRSAMKVIASQITLLGSKGDKPEDGTGEIEPF